MNFEKSQEAVSDDVLRFASNIIFDEEWKQLGPELGLEQGELSTIENDHKGDSKEKHLRMLRKWKQKSGRNATVQTLTAAISKIRSDVTQTLLTNPPKMKKKQILFQKQQVIRDYLRESYKDVQLPIGLLFRNKLFLSEHFLDLTLKLKFKLGEEEGESTLYIQKIFEEIGGKIPKIILIESDPGYGKTTLGLKLVSDWSNGRRYMTEKFDLVFNLSLTHFTGNLKKMLLKEVKLIDGISEKDKFEVIQCSKENVLLILDDFDQLPDPLKSELIQMLKWKEPFRKMTIVVTSTTEGIECKANDEDSGHISDIGAKSIEYEILSLWDERIQIKGISQANKEEFMNKYFSNVLFRKKYFNLITNRSKDFYYSPMYLLFLVILLKDKQVEKIKSRTEFFIKIFNYLTKRILLKSKAINREEEVDLFNGGETKASLYRSLLLQFGKLALENLKQKQKSFTREEILLYCKNDERIFHLGFLMRKTKYENHRLIITYETWHETIVEFLAAIFVSDTLLRSSPISTQNDNFIYSLMLDVPLYDPASFLGSFIIGLLKSKAYILLDYVHWSFYIFNIISIPLEMKYTYKNI